jgi:hypothetical protein
LKARSSERVFYCLKFSLFLSEPHLSDRSRSSFLTSFLIWSTSCLADISPSISLAGAN